MSAERPGWRRGDTARLLVGLSAVFASAAIAGTDLPAARHIALLVLLGAGFVVWLSRHIPRGATGLILLLAAQALGLTGGHFPFSGFGKSSFVFLIGVLCVAAGIREAGTADRLSQRALLRRPPLTAVDFLWKVPLLLFLSSAIISSATARVALLDQISRTVLASSPNVGGLPKYLTLYVGNISPLTSRAFLSGGPGVIIAADLMAGAGYPLNWFEWLIWLGVPVFIIFSLATALHWNWLRPEPLVVPTASPAPFGRADRLIGATVGGMVVLWIVGPAFNIGPAATAVLGALMIGKCAGPGSLRGVDWDLVVFSGATLSFGYLLLSSGTAAWVGNGFVHLLKLGAGSPFLVLGIFLSLVCLRVPLNNGASYSAVVLPIILSIGPVGGVEPFHLAFITLIAGGLAFLPIQSAPAMITFSTGRYGVGDAIVSGALIIACSAVVLQLFAIPYWIWLGRVIG